jgi:hypothetical protein
MEYKEKITLIKHYDVEDEGEEEKEVDESG